MHIPFLRKAAPGAQPTAAPAPRHEAPPGSQWHWLVTGEGDKMTGAPFPDRELAMIKFFRHVAVFGDGARARVMADKDWQAIRRGPGYCPGIGWGVVDEKVTFPTPAPCGWAYAHRRHPTAVKPYATGTAVVAAPR